MKSLLEGIGRALLANFRQILFRFGLQIRRVSAHPKMGLGSSSFIPASGSWYQVKFEHKPVKVNAGNDAELRQIFNAYDTDKNGFLTREEIVRALTHMHLDVDDANQLFDELDEKHENKITWDVFRKHAKEVEGELRELFDAIDTERLGYISAVEMTTALTKLGVHPTTAGIRDLLELLDEGPSAACGVDTSLLLPPPSPYLLTHPLPPWRQTTTVSSTSTTSSRCSPSCGRGTW